MLFNPSSDVRGLFYLFPDVDRSDTERGQIPRCWTPKYLEGPVSKDDTCSICLQNYFPTGELVLALSCGHYFHPECIWKYLFPNGDCNLTANGGDASVPTAMELCTIDSTKSCPLCRALPAVVGENQFCPAVGESVGIGTGGGAAPDPTGEMTAGVGELGPDESVGRDAPVLEACLFKLRATRSEMRTIIPPCRPCLAEHPSGYGTPKFCVSCIPSCRICRHHSSTWGCGPFWRAKDAKDDSNMFCDKCFWIRISLLGHLGCGRFERLETSSFLRPRFLDSGDGCLEDVLDEDQDLRGSSREESECERCGKKFPNTWRPYVEEWCSKCAPAPKGPASPGQPNPVAEADLPVGGNTTIVLNLRPASPGFLAPRPTPAAPVPPPDTSSTSSPGISGEVPNSKPAAEPKPGSKSEPKNPKARKPKPERVMLQTEETVGQNEVGSDKMRRLLTDIPR